MHGIRHPGELVFTVLLYSDFYRNLLKNDVWEVHYLRPRMRKNAFMTGYRILCGDSFFLHILKVLFHCNLFSSRANMTFIRSFTL